MITGRELVEAAVKALSLNITYDQEVCDVFVRKTIERAGGKYLRSAGANAMLRNLKWLYPLDDARANGSLKPGAVLFMVEPGWNSKYNDNMGSAEHIGIYTGIPGKEIIHSSASNKGVIASTFHRGHLWNYAGGMKDVNLEGFTSTDDNKYDGRGGEMEPTEPRGKTPMRVMLPPNKAGETVNVRRSTKSGAVILVTPRDGDPVMASEPFTVNGRAWRDVQIGSVTGVAWAEFFGPINSTDVPPYFPVTDGSTYIPVSQPTSNLEDRVAHLEDLLKLVMEEIGSRWL